QCANTSQPHTNQRITVIQTQSRTTLTSTRPRHNHTRPISKHSRRLKWLPAMPNQKDTKTPKQQPTLKTKAPPQPPKHKQQNTKTTTTNPPDTKTTKHKLPPKMRLLTS